MVKKTSKPVISKSLKEKLISAVHKVLKDNKSIKKIVKKTDKKIKEALTNK